MARVGKRSSCGSSSRTAASLRYQLSLILPAYSLEFFDCPDDENGLLARRQRRSGKETVNRIIQKSSSKVPEVTLAFWIIKILATTLGETGGDAVSMSMHLGYAIGSAVFIGIFVVAVDAQIAGTTMADFADRSLGIGCAGGSSILFVLLMLSLGIWYWSAGSVSVDTITSPNSPWCKWSRLRSCLWW
jgi:uncharacterized membrane-anchored protein